jgi:3-oxo-5alpha-steroid 4-dehydrogenase
MDDTGRVLGVEVNALPDSLKAEHGRLYKKVSPTAPFTSQRSERAIARCLILESQSATRRLVRARRGVVLATGGFEYNVPMLQRYMPRAAAHYKALMRSGAMGSYGSGIRLGQTAGGTTRLLDSKLIASFVSPPDTLLYGIIVNQDGERFINEDTYSGFLGNAINEQSDCKAWLILDSETFWRTIREALTPRGDGQFMTFKLPQLLNILFGGTKRGRSLRALAKKCGINGNKLEQTVAAYNAVATAGRPDPLGKNAKYVHAMRDGPFYAINKSNSNVFCFGFFMTLGGLAVDEQTGAVLRGDGSAIEGLYAAGRTAVGICSNTYISGLSLADLVFSGRRAARALAQPT